MDKGTLSSVHHQPSLLLQDAASLDTSGAVVSPAYRATPWAAEEVEAASARTAARILLVSESGICRSVLAAATLGAALARRDLGGEVEVRCAATRDYCSGEPPHPAAAAAAAALGLELPADEVGAQQFDEASDIAANELVVVMDKYTAADVLREVSVYDTIREGAGYSHRVRRLGKCSPLSVRCLSPSCRCILCPCAPQRKRAVCSLNAPRPPGGAGEFHPELSDASGAAAHPDAADIEDPLYGKGCVCGNLGGEEEAAAVLECARRIQESCEGLAQRLAELHEAAAAQGGSMRQAVAAAAAALDEPAWLVPPMLQRRG
eukprot:scaffold9.g3002.t1